MMNKLAYYMALLLVLCWGYYLGASIGTLNNLLYTCCILLTVWIVCELFWGKND